MILKKYCYSFRREMKKKKNENFVILPRRYWYGLLFLLFLLICKSVFLF